MTLLILTGRFRDEIAPGLVPGRKGDAIVEECEYIRSGTTIEQLAKLKPAFVKDGTVTAGKGTASGVNHGAAAAVLMSAREAERRESFPSLALQLGRQSALIRR